MGYWYCGWTTRVIALAIGFSVPYNGEELTISPCALSFWKVSFPISVSSPLGGGVAVLPGAGLAVLAGGGVAVQAISWDTPSSANRAPKRKKILLMRSPYQTVFRKAIRILSRWVGGRDAAESV